MKTEKTLLHYIRSYKFQSVLIKNLILFMGVLIVPIAAIAIIFYMNTSNFIQNEMKNLNKSTLYRIKDVTDTIIKEVDTLANYFSIQNNVHIFVLDQASDEIKELEQKILSSVNSYSYVYKYIDSIYIYSEISDSIITNEGTKKFSSHIDKTWYDTYKGLNSMDNAILSRKRNDKYPYYITVIKPLMIQGNKKIGAIIININIEELAKIIKNIDNPLPQSFYIIDKKGMIFYSDDFTLASQSISETPSLSFLGGKHTDYTGEVRKDGMDNIMSVVDSDIFSWQYVSLMPLTYYQKNMREVRVVMIYIVIMMVLIDAVSAFWLSTKTYKPFKTIMSAIEKPDSWDNQEQEDYGEIKYIIRSYMDAVTSKNEIERELEQRLATLKRVQMQSLQAQINPHFLYNTLEMIKWMAVGLTGGKNDISQTVTSLANLFKLSFDTRGYLITIREELEHVREYIKILILRYKNKFTVEWDVDESLLEYKIINICLQPVVENAIYHGIKPKRYFGTIKISVARENEDIILSVSDNGAGMTDEKIAEANKRLSLESEINMRGIGLHNINQRIKLIFGSAYGVSIESEKGVGTTVIVRIPAV